MKQRLRNFIADGKTGKVISQLRLIESYLDEELQEDIIIQSNRYKSYLRNKNNGLLSREEQGLQLNTINTSLLFIINQLPDNNYLSAPLSNRNKIIFFGITVFGLFTILSVYFLMTKNDFPKNNSKEIVSMEDSTIIDYKKNKLDSAQSKVTYSEYPPNELGNKKNETYRSKIPVSEKEPNTVNKTSLIVQSNFTEYHDLFEESAGVFLNNSKVPFRIGLYQNATQKVEFNFDLDKISYGEGSFAYELNLHIKVSNSSNEICDTVHYTSENPKIGYSDDNKSTIINKILIPLVDEIRKSYEMRLPNFCKN